MRRADKAIQRIVGVRIEESVPPAANERRDRSTCPPANPRLRRNP
jgi:hypothetical protein